MCRNRGLIGFSPYVLALVLLLSPSGGIASQGRNVRTVSPGSHARPLVVDSRCPTFSWAKVEGAVGYELVVYRTEKGEEPVRVFRKRFSGVPRSWTPRQDRCLERSQTYAWTLRALDAEVKAKGWARLRLFQVMSMPDWLLFEGASAGANVYPGREVPSGSVRRSIPSGGVAGGAGNTNLALPEAGAVASGVVISESDIMIDGEEVVTTATDTDALAALSCPVGQIAVSTGTGWVCGLP